MADRYEDALRDLEQVPPPDQWDEVVRRADGERWGPDEGTGGTGPGEQGERDLYRVVSLMPPRERPARLRGRTVAAAASVLVLLLVAGAYLIRSDDISRTTTIDRPEPSLPRPAPDEGPEPTPQTTVTVPPTTAPVPEEPEPASDPDPPVTDEPEVPAPATVPSQPDEMVGCADLRFTAQDGPDDVGPVQEDPVPGDPRLHEAAHPDLVGVFDSAAGDRVVFLIDSHGFGEDGGRRFDHAGLGEIWMAHNGEPAGSPDALGIVEISVELNEEFCPFTFWSVGLSEDELEGFARALEIGS